MQQFLWVIFPYLSLAIMIAGSLYRYAYRPMSWNARSSELLERRLLKWGSPLFHWGILMVIAGHVMGLLVPVAFYQALGISREMYHLNADILGAAAGLLTWTGLVILLIRRLGNRRVRVNSTLSDLLVLLLLLAVVTTGNIITLGYNNLVGPYGYRRTIGPWTRGLLTLHPNLALMVHIPLIFQIHITLAFLLFAISPFTRLVHIWSVPVAYLRRVPIQYRSRQQYR
ncbi:MAG: respiratory nitrate reductase subunit gamma [Thermaerobacter sp.]|nr:respiratory nitrate reductase subunit gamma [Thermaerobacter sp.]